MTREKEISKVTLVGGAGNLLLLAFKFTAGILAHSAAMRQWLWSDTLHNTSHFGTPMGWVHPIVSVLAVFAVCSLIDYLRARFLEKPLLPIIVNLAERGLEKCKWLNH